MSETINDEIQPEYYQETEMGRTVNITTIAEAVIRDYRAGLLTAIQKEIDEDKEGRVSAQYIVEFIRNFQLK